MLKDTRIKYLGPYTYAPTWVVAFHAWMQTSIISSHLLHVNCPILHDVGLTSPLSTLEPTPLDHTPGNPTHICDKCISKKLHRHMGTILGLTHCLQYVSSYCFIYSFSCHFLIFLFSFSNYFFTPCLTTFLFSFLMIFALHCSPLFFPYFFM